MAETAGGGVIGVAKMDGSDNLLIGDGNLKIDVTGTTARLTIDSSGNTTVAGTLTVQGATVNIGNTLFLDNNEIWAKNSNNLNVKADGVIKNTDPKITARKRRLSILVETQHLLAT